MAAGEKMSMTEKMKDENSFRQKGRFKKEESYRVVLVSGCRLRILAASNSIDYYLMAISLIRGLIRSRLSRLSNMRD